jgi:hypothetical protein
MHLERPIQEKVIENSLEEKGTISRVGKGWDPKTLSVCFEKPKEGSSPNRTGHLLGRTISSDAEAEETVWILKTLHSVRLLYDNKNGCGYSMTCNVHDVILRNPSFLEGTLKSFF